MLTVYTLFSYLLALTSAITIHEAAHAWMATKLGDPTPKLMGRLSLNPIVHYDKTGTTLLLVLAVLRVFGVPVIPFGWAKPVMFDPFNLKNPRRDAALISLAGPASNILLATAISLVLRLPLDMQMMNILNMILVPVIYLNIVLAIFNLLPIHPLDGGKIIVGILPERDAMNVDLFLRKYGMIILLFLIFPTIGGVSPLSSLLGPILRFFINLLIPNLQFI